MLRVKDTKATLRQVANNVLHNDVMLRLNDAALRANELTNRQFYAILKPERRCGYDH